jgi:uncharacterized protein
MHARRLLGSMALCLILAVAAVGCGGATTTKPTESANPAPQAPAETQRLSLVTAGTGGAWYPIGSGIADLVNKQLKGVQMAGEVTQGGIENVRLLHGNKAQFGFANFDAALQGYSGQKPFDDGKKDILGVASLYPSTLQVVVLDNSPIKGMKDLKGKRVVVGPPASSSAVMGYNVLEAYGIGKDDIKGLQLAFAEGADALKDGNADVLFVASAHPNSTVMDLAATKAIRLIPIEPDMQEKISKQYGYYGKISIPKGTYKGQNQDVPTLSLSTMIIVNKDVSEKTVYDFTKVLFDNLETVKGFHAVMAGVRIEDAPNTPIPLHPGAIKYFKEKGLLK